MKKNIITLVLSTLILTGLAGCNGLREDKAPKAGINLSKLKKLDQELNSENFSSNFNAEPDSLTAFFWPGEKYYQDCLDKGLTEAANLQEFIRDTSAKIFRSGADYDDWVLIGLLELPGINAELREIETLEAPFIEQRDLLQDRIKELKEDIKAIKKQQKALKKQLSENKKSRKKLNDSLEELNSSYQELSCDQVLSEVGNDNQANCQQLKDDISASQQQLDKVVSDIEDLNRQMKESNDQIAATKQAIKPIFEQKKQIENENLAPLRARKGPLVARDAEITIEQSEMIARVQVALDPLAVEYTLDQDGNPTYDENGNMVRKVVEERQVNWLKLYENAAKENNIFLLKDGVLEIKFGEWGDFKSVYQTKYHRDQLGAVEIGANGEPRLTSDSDIYDIEVLDNGVVNFKMDEKDIKGNKTGNVYRFQLQRSKFDIHARVQGDLIVSDHHGTDFKWGQFKTILTKRNYDKQ